MHQLPVLGLLACTPVCQVVRVSPKLELVCRLHLRRLSPLMANAIDTTDPPVHNGQNDHKGQHSDRTKPNDTFFQDSQFPYN